MAVCHVLCTRLTLKVRRTKHFTSIIVFLLLSLTSRQNKITNFFVFFFSFFFRFKNQNAQCESPKQDNINIISSALLYKLYTRS